MSALYEWWDGIDGAYARVTTPPSAAPAWRIYYCPNGVILRNVGVGLSMTYLYIKV